MAVYLSLGSNLGSAAGDPRQTVIAAAAAIGRLPETRSLRLSRVYRTAPWGPVAQPDFANAVAELEWQDSAERLLVAVRILEDAFGRVRHQRWGPRTLDIDLLLFGVERREGPELVLPHPRLHQRRFVLVPLVELAPEVVHPRLGATAAQLLSALPAREPIEPIELWQAAA